MYGENPTLKQKKKYCETCLKEMKVKDKCEWHSDVEPCYFCHLILHHFGKGEDKTTKKSSRKETPVQQT